MSIGKALRIMKHRGVGVDYVDDTVIPFVDKKMKPLKIQGRLYYREQPLVLLEIK